MIRAFVIAAVSTALLALSSIAFAQGTADEAKAMLAKAVDAV